MASSYRGLYKCEPKSDRPTHIQVIELGGNSLSLTTDEYEKREVQPSWKTLPWHSDYKSN